MNLDDLLHDAPAERVMPDELRGRLEEMLRARAWAEAPEDNPLEGIDTPRPVPPPARDRIETAMRASARELLDRLDESVAMPAETRARLEAALVRVPAPARQRWVARALAVAAAAMLIATSVTAVLRAPSAPPSAGGPLSPVPSLVPPTGIPRAGGIAVDEVVDEPASSVGDFVGPPPASFEGNSGAPPFAFTYAYAPEPAPLMPDDAGFGAPAAPPPPPPPPLVVAVARGDAALEAGFDAYIALLNRGGGIAGRSVTVLDAEDAVRPDVTVNLSSAPLDPATVRGPILEAPTATEATLRGRALGFASPPERQARALAATLLPRAAGPGTTAVIYHAGGAPWDDAVPDALEAELRGRDVAVARIGFVPGSATNLFVAGDYAFLSMDTAASVAWLRQARAIGYRPGEALGGVYPMFDAGLLPLLDGLPARILSPYQLPINAETGSRAFRRIGEPHGARSIHGWVTAKSIAVAAWLREPVGARAMADALRRLRGYENGFAPPYETRSGTNARIPDGLLYGVEDGRFVALSGFVTEG